MQKASCSKTKTYVRSETCEPFIWRSSALCARSHPKEEARGDGGTLVEGRRARPTTLVSFVVFVLLPITERKRRRLHKCSVRVPLFYHVRARAVRLVCTHPRLVALLAHPRRVAPLAYPLVPNILCTILYCLPFQATPQPFGADFLSSAECCCVQDCDVVCCRAPSTESAIMCSSNQLAMQCSATCRNQPLRLCTKALASSTCHVARRFAM